MKLSRVCILDHQFRRPFTGAWIETPTARPVRASKRRRPFTGAWIETQPSGKVSWLMGVAPSRGRGLKLLRGVRCAVQSESPLHGGVD